jgi:Clostripain family
MMAVDATNGQVQRPWLLMLYMSADAANLQAPLMTELEELVRPIREKGGTQQDLYVVAQIQTPGGVLKRYDLSSGQPLWVETGKTDALNDFLDFARKVGPAAYEALVFWGHSAGVGNTMQPSRLPGDIADLIRARGGLWDLTFKAIDPLALSRTSGQGTAQRLTRLVNILAFDSCYLASLEVALQFSSYGERMLACENSISLTGWQFDIMVDAILSDSQITPPVLAESMVGAVGITRKSPTTLSLYDLSATAKVTQNLKDLVGTLTDALEGKAKGQPPVAPFEARLWVIDAFHHATSTKVRQFLDLPDLCRRLAAEGPGRDVRRAARALLRDLGSLLVDSVDITGTSLGGLSIYCPWPRATEGEVYQGARNVEIDPDRYANYELSKQTGWDKLMGRAEIVLDAERRAVRRQAREYLARARSRPANGGTHAWEAKPIEMDMKPIEMEMKPIQMEVMPIETEILAGM